MASHPLHISGFTLIELIVVIALLGILSAVALPRFTDLDREAHIASHEATAAAFVTAVNLARSKWMALGSPSTLNGRNDVQLHGSGTEGQIDFNEQGWPAQSYAGPDVVINADSVEDCEDIWPVLLNSSLTASHNDPTTDYGVTHEVNDVCIYTYRASDGLSFRYETLTGEVTVVVDEG